MIALGAFRVSVGSRMEWSPMSPEQFLVRIQDPGLLRLLELGGPPLTRDARRMMLCIALQESGPQLEARYQNSPSSSPGPARSFWQFESGGGCAGVLTHRASKDLAHALCRECTVQPHAAAVWRAMEGHDILAAGFARLLLWTLPEPLPAMESDGWTQYMSAWRPGKPHRDAWSRNWPVATAATESAGV